MGGRRWFTVLALAGLLAVLAACNGYAVAQEEDAVQPGQQDVQATLEPDATPGPTEESLRELLDAYEETFNAEDWQALYALEPEEFREHCAEADYVMSLQFTSAIIKSFMGAPPHATLAVRATDAQVIGTEGYVAMEFVLDDTVVSTDSPDPLADEPNWVFEDGQWQRRIPDWLPERGCDMGFDLG